MEQRRTHKNRINGHSVTSSRLYIKLVSWTWTASVFSQSCTSPISQSFHAASLFGRKSRPAVLFGDHRTISWVTRRDTAMTYERRSMMRIPTKLKPWFEARRRFKLSHAHTQMATRTGHESAEARVACRQRAGAMETAAPGVYRRMLP